MKMGSLPQFLQEAQQSDALAGEVAALRREIAALRAELSPIPALILTGRNVIDEFKRLQQQAAKP
jgi:prefoldin subunit 5